MTHVQHALTEKPPGHRHKSVLFPALLIGLGAIFLAQNLGWVSSDIWLGLWHYWPVFLILVGIDLVIGRSRWAATMGLLVVALLLLASVMLTSSVVQIPGWTISQGWSLVSAPTSVDHVTEELAELRSARIDLRHAVGRLSVVSLPSDSEALIQADLEHPENTEIQRTFQRNGQTAEIRLIDQSRRDILSGVKKGDWAVHLSPKLPIELNMETGASELDLDLRGLAATRVDITTGASRGRVVLPEAAGRISAHINAGATGLDVIIPPGVAARILSEGGLSNVTIDQRFPRTGRYYQSPDFDSATNRVDLQIDSGVSSVTVR